jgi:hypothetical protein
MGIFGWLKKAIRFIGSPVVRGFDWVRNKVNTALRSVDDFARNRLRLGGVLDFVENAKIPIPGVGDYSLSDLA